MTFLDDGESLQNHLMSLTNDALYEIEKSLPSFREDTFPCVYVGGAPRSGTTLFTQVLAHSLQLCPISNLSAYFWRAPTVGLGISKKLLGSDFKSSFSSEYGRTKNIAEPHEFGFFWKDILGAEGLLEPTQDDVINVDWRRVKTTILRMQKMAGNGLVFKAFLASYYAEEMVKALPKSIFVRLERDELENAYSIYVGREKYAGSINGWLSVKPLNYEKIKNLEPLAQAAVQVRQANLTLGNIWARLPKLNQLTVRYEDFCNSPDTVLSDIKSRVDALSGSISEFRAVPEHSLVRSSDQIPSDIREKLEVIFSNLD